MVFVHVKWFLFAAAQPAERLKIAFQAVDPPFCMTPRYAFELVWGFYLSSGCFRFIGSFLFGAGGPFFIPSPTIRFPERAEGVKGPKR
jgi:hypothetical protein